MSTTAAMQSEAIEDDAAPNRAPLQIQGEAGTELAVRRAPEVRVVQDNIAVLDTARFEHMQRIATVMARSMLIPEALCMYGPAANRQMLPDASIVANCFLVVNQAVRWNMDPFAVSQCVSVISGKLCYEGKLIAAVLESMLHIKLHYYFTGDPATDGYRIYVADRQFTDEVVKQLKPGLQIPGLRLWTGSVGEWKTTRKGSPWSLVKNYTRMLIYRGSRDWTRIYESALMLGVLADDEIDDETRARTARDVTPSEEDGPPAPPAPPPAVTASPPTAPAAAPEPELSMASLYDEKPAEQVVWEDAEADGPPAPDVTPARDPLELPPELDRRKNKTAMAEATAADVFDPAQWLKDLDGALGSCEDMVSMGEKWAAVAAPHQKTVFPPDWSKAIGLFKTHSSRIGRMDVG